MRETKGSAAVEELRGTEGMKIACARRHFEAIGVYYDVVTSAGEMRRGALGAHPS